jgi:kynurenine formamidase
LEKLAAAEEPTLWAIQQTIISKKFVDLTHGFTPGIPRWPGFPDETRKTNYDDYSLETYIMRTNHYQIELLTNLDQVPKRGQLW